ncbi:hypothetical protein OsJ_26633 [Oryza sativa Japonica Group]|uniref:Uncharacterized protein n=1 Tax=Oryza sativa subsp. japonica TaxID=39947 RepID=B9FZX2_ORYSJ|nr:hypothetical protein OsJ_26633 [Oryza sativa Japonica Group]
MHQLQLSGKALDQWWRARDNRLLGQAVLELTRKAAESGGVHLGQDYCYKAIGKLIVCVGPTCKLDCWLEAKYNKGRVKRHKCMKHGIFAKCYCEICVTF